jgi:putative Ca2+/H+ antiporter (TMEM165/GDT1 family)
MTLDIAAVALAFVLIFPAELPDKTFLATLVLATRYRRFPVWIGVGAAFGVQSLIAVTAGGLLSLLPRAWVLGFSFLLFAAGAVLMIITGLRERKAARDQIEATPPATGSWRIALISFGVLFTAEWGDLSQFVTAGLAAQTAAPLSVFIGAWAALLAVSGLAVLLGAWLSTRISLWRVRLVSGALLGAISVWTLSEFVAAIQTG